MNNAVYGETIEIFHKIYGNDLVAIRKNKVTLTLNKPALFTDTDSLMYEIKTEDVYEDFSNNKEMFDFINCSTKSKYYDNSNKR